MFTGTKTSINKYILEQNRINSFKSWPYDENCMAEAGFYWCGNEKDIDTVSCFVCNKLLDGWEPTDNPWSEHKKHAPQCGFVKLGRREDELTVEELFNLIEIKLTNNLTKKYNEIMKTTDQIRKELVDQL